jgi:hypothetical protein
LRLTGFSTQPSLGGGFIWSLDLACDTVKNLPIRGNGCGGTGRNFPVTYLAAVKKGLSGQ